MSGFISHFLKIFLKRSLSRKTDFGPIFVRFWLGQCPESVTRKRYNTEKCLPRKGTFLRCLPSDGISMSKLVLPVQCCCIVHASVRTLRCGSTATVKRQTGLVSGDLGGRISGNEAQRVVCLCRIIAAATLACHSTSSRHVCVPPLLSRVCMCAWGLVAVGSSYTSEARTKTKSNSIID